MNEKYRGRGKHILEKENMIHETVGRGRHVRLYRERRRQPKYSLRTVALPVLKPVLGNIIVFLKE